MTSIPASRSARATTLAPRSWPSRPGFAMTTRMGRSAMTASLSPATGDRPGRRRCRRSALRGDLVEALDHVGGDVEALVGPHQSGRVLVQDELDALVHPERFDD